MSTPSIPHDMKNISDALTFHARHRPDAVALVMSDGRHADGRRRYATTTFAQLESQVCALARGLLRCGLRPGLRTVVMVPPSDGLVPLTFGLLRAGIVPVMVDPGLGVAQLGRCLADAAPEAFIGVPRAHAARLLLGWGRATVRHTFTTQASLLASGPTLGLVASVGADATTPLPPVDDDDLAAVLFTSGSTGPAKGVEYRHRHFVAQARMLQATYGIAPGEVDLPTFPLFALFDPALGMTTVLPEMDFTRPARVDPAMLTELVHDWQVTNVFGSPALLATVAEAARKSPMHWPTVRRVLSAGAPVSVRVVEGMAPVLPAEAQLFTPYGATECLPVASIGSRDLQATRASTLAGAGVCVGRVVPPNDVRIVAIDDAPHADWGALRELPPGEVGEITVYGPTTTERYSGRAEATAAAKVARDGRVVHRMGDTGYFDNEGRLWFCGRKSQRVVLEDRTLHTAMVEEPFHAHPGVRRAALVGIVRGGLRQPVICIERHEGVKQPRTEILAELRALAASLPVTHGLDTFLFHPRFPVDVRHNAKIGREKLAAWAQEQLG